MEPIDCPECKRLFDSARDAIQAHIRAQGNWQIASLRRDVPEKIASLRAAQDAAAITRARAVSAYRQHMSTHLKE